MASNKINNTTTRVGTRKKLIEKQKHARRRRGLLYTALALAAVFSLTAIIIAGYVLINVMSYRNQEPVIDLEKERNRQSQTSFIYAYDKDQKLVELARLHGTENRVWVDLDTMPKYLQEAAIALEDKRFEKHHGVDWIRTISAMTIHGFSQGGSTLTQQLIKNLTNEKDVTFVRKYKEIVMALNMDKNYSKDKILEAYLNTLYLGNGCYGVRTAAETYFGKDVDKLNLAECAVLVSITQAPSEYDPLRNPESNQNRQRYCLKSMLEQGRISQEEYDRAINYKLVFTNSVDYVADPSRQQKSTTQTNKKINSYYVDFVIETVIQDLMRTQGYSRSQASDKLYYGGLKIYAAVDLELQKELEYVYENRITFPASTKTKKNSNGAQSAMTIMDYEGRVMGIVGGVGKKTANRSLNRALSFRQPGSTIKPLATYSPALEYNEIQWTSYINNSAIMINGKKFPHNVDGTYGSGKNVGMKEAIQKSYNTVPTRIIQKMGFEKSFDSLQSRFHLSRLDKTKDMDYAPLATGSLTNGTNTLEMAAAYAAFGNGGKYYKPYAYYKVLDGADNDNVLIDNTKPSFEQAVSPATADIMQELLKTVSTSSYGKGSNVRRFEIMAKTGTTNDHKDRWFCMGTPYYVSATWYGYDEPERIQANANPSAKLAIAVHDRVHKGLADKQFVKSEETAQRKYCNKTHLLASNNCSSTSLGWFDTAKLPGTCTSCSAAEPVNGLPGSESSTNNAVATTQAAAEATAEPAGNEIPSASDAVEE